MRRDPYASNAPEPHYSARSEIGGLNGEFILHLRCKMAKTTVSVAY